VHDIDVGDAVPIKQHFYRVSLEKLRNLDSEMKYMLVIDMVLVFDQLYLCGVIVGFVFGSLLVHDFYGRGCYAPLALPASFSLFVFLFSDWGQVELFGSLR
jgi:hypothetical protein